MFLNGQGYLFEVPNLFGVILNLLGYIFGPCIDSAAELLNIIIWENILRTLILTDVGNKNKHLLETQKQDQVVYQLSISFTSFFQRPVFLLQQFDQIKGRYGKRGQKEMVPA